MQENTRGSCSKHEQRVGKMAAGSTVDGGLVRELNSGSESRGVGGVNIGGYIRGRLNGVIASDIDRLDEGIEVASGNVVGVVPVDHTSCPLNGALRGSWDTGGPYTSVGTRMSVSS